MKPLSLLPILALAGCSVAAKETPEVARPAAAAFLERVEATAPADRPALLKGHPAERDALRADPIMKARLDRALGIQR